MGHISKLRNIHRPNLARPSSGCPHLFSTTAAHHATRLATNARSASTSKLAQELQATHKDWTVEDRKQVLWSDESKINHLGSDGVQWAWRLPGEKLTEWLTKPTAHSGGGSLMVWGSIGGDGAGFLTNLDVNMPKELYVEVLKHDLMDTLEYYGKEVGNILFQRDNAPSDKAGLTGNWPSDHGFEVLKWPSYSPDLNSIENLWSHLKRELGSYDQPPRGILEWWDRAHEKWEEIGPQVWQYLI
jgi:hypothetical protein